MFDGVNPESWIVQDDRYYSHQNELGMISLNFKWSAVRSWLAGMLRRKKNLRVGLTLNNNCYLDLILL